jgi:hypothetical protein
MIDLINSERLVDDQLFSDHFTLAFDFDDVQSGAVNAELRHRVVGEISHHHSSVGIKYRDALASVKSAQGYITGGWVWVEACLLRKCFSFLHTHRSQLHAFDHRESHHLKGSVVVGHLGAVVNRERITGLCVAEVYFPLDGFVWVETVFLRC